MTNEEKIKELTKLIIVCEDRYYQRLNDQVIQKERNDLICLDDKQTDDMVTRGGSKGQAFKLSSCIAPTFGLGANEFVYRVLLDLRKPVEELKKSIDPLFKQMLRIHVRTTGAHPNLMPVEGSVYLTTKMPHCNNERLRPDEFGFAELRFYSNIV